ncbi:MAG: Fic family protein [Candidatus Marinimicrobia bacterium]|nr:Fic family protein [Candidatus Neomarinimicrobiota bacterium]
MAKVLNIYKKIDVLRERYNKSAHKKESLLHLLGETEVAEHVYNSNAIENSTLSLDETEKILMQIDLERFISERELFEAKNLARVVTYINTKAKQQELNLDLILILHKMLISNIRDEIAGRIRQENEWVRVGNYIACDPKLIQDKIDEMFIQYYSKPSENIIKRIAVFHLTFEHIHPFVDGNGRIGRVLNNYLLIREGYVPINIKFIDRLLYYDAFQEFDENANSSIMEEIIGKAITNSYHKRLAYLDGLEIMTLNEYAQRNNISHSNLINKAKRQTVDAFIEKGIWKIGVSP